MNKSSIKIMDTTLRDGEQTEGVCFTKEEKFAIAQYLIEKVGVDAVEITSARMSEGEYDSLRTITDWAKKTGNLEKIEVLAFVDNNKSAEWVYNAGGRVLNLLTKGSLKHVTLQLKKTPEQHAQDISVICEYAKQKGITVHVYLEDWSNGIQDSPDYVMFLIHKLEEFGVKRVMLADTLGVLNPFNTKELVKKTITPFPNIMFDFHGHNDYSLAVANSLAAISAGVSRVHTTVNGLGERTGNTDLSALNVAIVDQLGLKTNVHDNELKEISKLVEIFSGIKVSQTAPVIGDNVFTQNCGVHADGDKKGGLYETKLDPKRFGAQRRYSLGKTSGISSIEQNFKKLGIMVDDDTKKKITKKVVELGEKKHSLTEADLPFIIADVLGEPIKNSVILEDYKFEVVKNKEPSVWIKLEIEGKDYEEKGFGDGQYDAFMNALSKIYEKNNMQMPELIDYAVRIPPGGKTSALVETSITWKMDEQIFKTKGVDSDQLVSALNATIKMLNLKTK